MSDRREFMGILAKVTMGAALTGADLALLSTPAVATPTPARVGATEVGQLADLTKVLWVQEKQLGGGAVREAVIAQLGWARGLLEAGATDRVGRELRGVVSDLLALAGRASSDVGLTGTALRYLGQAVAMAQEVGEPVRAALALGQIGRIHTRDGNSGQARDVLNLAMVTADRTRSSGLNALLLTSQARAAAQARTPDQAVTYLARAEDALSSTDTAAEPTGFDRTLFASEAGRVYTILTTQSPIYASQAIDTLTASTAQLASGRAKRRAFALTELATCHLHGGDSATGIHIGHQVVCMAATIRSRKLTEHLQLLRTATRANPSPAAKELNHRLAGMG
ncbi:hypothetical protein V5P93_006492 [Actinokineospora auranticolor]|uniref:Transcriptional regulator n=1 Tax=Actinokineospora auranticolor TaxID=155976 RepID=A0A2S6GXC2_9PSEU|nr:hypothetical protein [Actinokineospora auranticolor]PPK69869.1 hypothetical protein CLV40_103479 [Actinokineospora auranticolor]